LNIESPITGTHKTRKIYSLDLELLRKGYKDSLQIDIDYLLDGVTDLSCYECMETGFRFFHPPVPGDSRFYQQLEKKDWYYAPNKWEHRVGLEIIDQGPVLEVGCGHGHFLEKLKEKGIEGIGLDTNAEAVNYCQENDLEVFCSSLREYSEKYVGTKFQYIVLFQLLEHIYDLKEFMEEILQLLAPEGKLLVAVPNNNSPVFKISPRYMYNDEALLLNLPPHHAGHFSEKSIGRFARYFGLAMDSLKYEPVYNVRLSLVADHFLLKYLKVFRNNKFIKKKAVNYFTKNRLKIKGDSLFAVLKRK
jgi:SAM-dependent methyltransferase